MMKYENMESFHYSGGKFVQLIGLIITPSHQGIGLSNELLSFGLLHNFVKSNVKAVTGITRCARYKPELGDYSAYINQKNRFGYIADPILNIHYMEGADIIGTIPGFREMDKDNSGNGVHIRYEFSDWIEKKKDLKLCNR